MGIHGIQRIFVYGTLKKEFSNNYLLKDSTFIGEGRTKDNIFYLRQLGSFPAMFKGGKDYIFGEIYHVNTDTLSVLDNLENHPDWYKREIIQVVGDKGQTLDCWCYIMTPAWEKLYVKCKIVEKGYFTKEMNELHHLN